MSRESLSRRVPSTSYPQPSIIVLQGAVANFVESEQIVVLEDKQGNVTTSSFVQIRGSIPLLWSQIPNIKYKPPTRIAPPTEYHPAFDRHFKELLETYQVRSLLVPVCSLSLIDLDAQDSSAVSGFSRLAFQQTAHFETCRT